jgi:hypothetical protein
LGLALLADHAGHSGAFDDTGHLAPAG